MSRDPLHGRGARTNASGRYERFAREAFDDGWGGDEIQPLETIVTPEIAKTIISTNQSPDISFDQSINPYRGCEHGCIYCYARPNHAYVGLSPGLDFETRLFVKANAAEAPDAFVKFNVRGTPTFMVLTGADATGSKAIHQRYRATGLVKKDVLARSIDQALEAAAG